MKGSFLVVYASERTRMYLRTPEISSGSTPPDRAAMFSTSANNMLCTALVSELASFEFELKTQGLKMSCLQTLPGQYGAHCYLFHKN